MANGKMTPVHAHSSTSFSARSNKHELQTAYKMLEITLTDQKKRDNTFYIRLLNRWIQEIRSSGVRFGSEEFLIVENVELLKFASCSFPFCLTRSYRIRLEIRRNRNQNADHLLRKWRENLGEIKITKYSALITLTKIEDL